MEIKVKTSSAFLTEKKYILRYVFEEFFGIPFFLSEEQSEGYELSWNGQTRMVIRDHFFSRVAHDNELISESLLPDKVNGKARLHEKDFELDVLFGSPGIWNEKGILYCDIDVFGTAFFFLSRIEEVLIKHRDEFGRFPFSESVYSKLALRNYPIVNATLELLFELLVMAGYPGTRKPRSFSIDSSVDIDHPFKFWNHTRFSGMIKQVLLGNTGPLGRIQYFKSYFISQKKPEIDPFFIELEKLLTRLDKENSGNPTKVFLLVGDKRKNTFNRLPIDKGRFGMVVNQISKHNISIGLHPGFHSMENPALIKKEKELAQAGGKEIKMSRFHYLRFSFPESFWVLADAGISEDHSIGFAEKPGFRAGICDPFPLFDPIHRKEVKIQAHPLLVMDQTLISPRYRSSDVNLLSMASECCKMTRLFKGTFSVLWHNSTIFESGGQQASKFLEGLTNGN